MRLVRGLYNAGRPAEGTVLTIGNFDGLHRGHQALIGATREHARRLGAEAVALSFDPTAREFFQPEGAPGRIGTLRGQLRLFAEWGLDRVIVQRFGRRFAGWEAEPFVLQGLVSQLGLRGIVVGDDFRFGARRSGDLDLLRRLGAAHGFFVDVIGGVCFEGLRCSSTAVRSALAEPDLETAERLLGRPYTVVGRVRGGLRLGRKLGMPTANIVLRRRPALRLGVYAVTARVLGAVGAPEWRGVANAGVRPTLGLRQCLLETHLMEASPDLYGQTLEVRLRHFLRPEARFESVDALAAQMHRDKADAMAFFRVATDN